MKKIAIFIFCVITTIIIMMQCINTAAFSNMWLKVVESEYIIPHESSIISFTPTVMNSGSGDWWIYGEDQNNYYYYIGDEITPYIFVSKKQSLKNTEFDSRNYMTWNVDHVTLELIKRCE